MRQTANLLSTLLLTTLTAFAQVEDEYFEMSIEELINVPIVTASRIDTSLKSTKSAAFVLTGEEIKRLGVTTVADALRVVPGIRVERVDVNKWAISARSFTGVFSNKVLVLVDGVNAYNPFTTGVYWDTMDFYLEDIDRIEVIKGPGGLYWGANAVNGVINIITKSAHSTVGDSAYLGGGNQDTLLSGYRKGFSLGKNTSGRIYAKFTRREDLPVTTRQFSLQDFLPLEPHHYDTSSSGFRIDSEPNPADSLRIQGDITLLRGDAVSSFRGTQVDDIGPRTDIAVGELRGKRYSTYVNWTRILSATSNFTVQTYLLGEQRDEGRSLFQDRITGDIDFQHTFQVGNSTSILWGTNIRLARDEVKSNEGSALSVNPTSESLFYHSAFLEIAQQLSDNLELSVGTKTFNGPFDDLQWQPSIRLGYQINNGPFLWTAASRAIRVPSRFEADGNLFVNTVTVGSVRGSIQVQNAENVDTEYVQTLEVGIRHSFSDSLSLDVATFYNDYEKLAWYRSEENRPTDLGRLAGQQVIILPLRTFWELEANSYGGEAVINWNPLKDWRLQASYAYLKLDVTEPTIGFSGSTTGTTFQFVPEHQATLRSLANLSESLRFDTTFRYADATSNTLADSVRDNSFFNIDVRLAYKFHTDWELSVAGFNLLDKVTEHGDPTGQLIPAQVERSVVGRLSYRF